MPWHCLYFLPLPQGHGSLRPTLGTVATPPNDGPDDAAAVAAAAVGASSVALAYTGTDPIPKVGRNEPCPCGSGKKYKQCHGKLA